MSCSWQARGFCLVLGGCRTWPEFDRHWVDVSIVLGTRVIMAFLIHTCLNIIMQIYLSLDFYAFQSILHIICLLYIVAI